MNKKLKFLKIVTILSGGISCILIGFNFVLPFIIKLILKAEFDKTKSADASSIGIIGGADGPTTIFLANNNQNFKYILIGLFVIITSAGIFLYRRIKNHK